MNAPAVPSIHYRRRWFYALWVSLLVLASAALWLWERPARRFEASLVIKMQLKEAPAGTQVRVWAGPKASWHGMEAGGPCLVQGALQDDGRIVLPLLRIHVASRRWVRDYVPRGTWDVVQLQFIPPGGPPRYFTVPLDQDIRSGILRPGWRLTTEITCHWRGLRSDPLAPDRVT
jgi:hypothetical protein